MFTRHQGRTKANGTYYRTMEGQRGRGKILGEHENQNRDYEPYKRTDQSVMQIDLQPQP
jgi:hypothetical protein